MYTPSDAEWIREAREREAYQLSEGRWSVEGAVVLKPQNNLLSRARTWLRSLKPSLKPRVSDKAPLTQQTAHEQ